MCSWRSFLLFIAASSLPAVLSQAPQSTFTALAPLPTFESTNSFFEFTNPSFDGTNFSNSANFAMDENAHIQWNTNSDSYIIILAQEIFPPFAGVSPTFVDPVSIFGT